MSNATERRESKPSEPMRHLLRMGHPTLLKVAEPVAAFGALWLRELVEEMVAVMDAEKGVGLAAPQIGESIRVIVFGYPDPNNKRGIPPIPATVLINPVLTMVGDEQEDDWEACLSVPGLIGKVPRYKRLQYAGFDVDGQPLSREAEGFHARILQHECDHLDGRLYPTRILSTTSFGFKEEIQLARDEGVL